MRYFAWLGLIAFLGFTACSSPSNTADTGLTAAQQLDSTLTQLARRPALPGFCVVEVTPDSVRYQRGFGYADVATKKPFTPATIQYIGSISKTLIGISLMQLVERGKLTLDTDINTILPFRVVNPHQPDSVIRVRHLATHTSGIIDRYEAYELGYERTRLPTTSLGDYLKQYLTPGGKYYSPANFGNYVPGTRYEYSNIGAALAGYLVETIEKQSYADYTQQHILTPLQLTDSHWYYDSARAARYATPYDSAGRPHAYYSLVTYPDGGLRSSGRDLGHYLQAMMRAYADKSLADEQLLTPASSRTLFAPRFTAAAMPANVPAKEPNIGVFWITDRKGRLGHTGGDYGVATFMWFDPEKLVGRVVIFNSDLETPAQIEYARKIMTALQDFEDAR